MNFDDIFRSFFGFNDPSNRPNHGQDEEFGDPRYFGPPGFGPQDEDNGRPGSDSFGPRVFHFSETDDMFRHFDDMFKNFEEVFKGMGMTEFPRMQPGIPPEIEGPSHDKSGSLRDYMLKEPEGGSTGPAVVTPPKQPHRHPGMFGELWDGLFGRSNSTPRREEKVDKDLDGEVSEDNLDDILRVPKQDQWVPRQGQLVPHMPQQRPSTNFSYSVRKYTNANGKVEETRTEKLPDGTTQTTVTRSLGDKSYTVTTKDDGQGGKATKEDFVNIDQKDKDTFDRLWRSGNSQNNRELMAPPAPRDNMVQSEADEQKSIFKNIFGIDFPNFRR